MKTSVGSPLIRIARRPAVTVPLSASVADAVAAMAAANVGAVVVLDGEQLAGIFTERDVMRKVVAEARDARQVPVTEVMARDVVSVGPGARRSEALSIMLERHFRHLPVLDEVGRLQGILSIRHLLKHQLERLKEQMDSLEQYIAADGPGG